MQLIGTPNEILFLNRMAHVITYVFQHGAIRTACYFFAASRLRIILTNSGETPR